MNGYIQKLMSPGEAVILESHQHPLFLLIAVRPWLLLLLLILFLGRLLNGIARSFSSQSSTQTVELIGSILGWLTLLAVFAVFVAFAYTYLVWYSTWFIVTNRRAILMTGTIIKKESHDVALEKINDIYLDQGIGGRMFNYGDIKFEAGNDDPVIMIKVARPLDFKKVALGAKAELLGLNYIRQNPAPRPAPTSAYPQAYPQMYAPPAPPYMPPPPAPRSYLPAPPAQHPYSLPPPAPMYGWNSARADALRELDNLRTQNLITIAEYNQKRAEILGRILCPAVALT